MNLNASLQQLAAGAIGMVAGFIVYKTDAGEYRNYEIVGYISMGFSVICLIVTQFVKPIEQETIKK